MRNPSLFPLKPYCFNGFRGIYFHSDSWPFVVRNEKVHYLFLYFGLTTRTRVANYMRCYNEERIQEKLGYLTPVEYGYQAA
ncbi:IS3 family transposase [Lysinibacillus sp. CNPSo 3705]|uniref:IS3 family transposase n=1 Tax=Lysinibacillus sp. CNPSo 3705 TaxID=3028148 RepID=UPI0034DE0ED2